MANTEQEQKTNKELYEEKKALRQAKRREQEKKDAKKLKKDSKKDYYRNPANTLIGKILIWVLSLSMLAGIFTSFGYLIYKFFIK